MDKKTDWEVEIEYGPTAADVHCIIVKASSKDEAVDAGYVWAQKNRMSDAMISNAYEVPEDVPILDEDYDEFLEWTPEEEEAFVKMVGKDLD